MGRKILVSAFFILVLASAAWANNVVTVPFQQLPNQLGWVEDEFIVVFNPETAHQMAVTKEVGRPQVNVASVQSRIDQTGVEHFRRQFPTAQPMAAGANRPDLTGHYKVKLMPGADLETAMAAFAADPNVDHVERIGIHPVYATPNDPYYQDSPNPDFPYDQWHYWNDHSVDADLAWDANAGDATVVVGILDSGTRYFHLDLGGDSPQWGPDAPFAGGNIFINPAETPGNGVDDDANGYIDDVIGWDFVSDASGGFGVSCIDVDCGTADNDPDDGNGHGTHVSGTVGAITNNNRLVAGVAGGFSDGTTSGVGNGVELLPCRIGYHASYRGQTTGVVRMDWAAEAMYYVSGLVDAGINVAAINCSWGSSNSGGLDAAVTDLIAHDVVVVVAAGNSNSSSPDYLGSRGDCLDVAATDINGDGASFTNYGSWVDVAAPGVDILSTYRNPDDTDPANHYIAVISGTSMSAPHVAGIVGLLESCVPTLSGPDKFSLIVNNTDPYTDSRDLGSGIANAKKAFDAAGCTGTPCDLVADFTSDVTSGCASLTVNFSDLSTGTDIDGWSWDFGDGGTSTAQNPSYTYSAAGTYSVSLTVSSSTQGCSDTETKTGYITVQDVPVADFSGSPTSGDAPLTVDFTDLSSGGPTSWSWDFGDGGTSTSQNPSYTYDTAGTYTVSLTASNACGSDLVTKTDYITVSEPAAGVVVHVSDITVQRRTRGPWLNGEAFVTIVDAGGSPVANATVYGYFNEPDSTVTNTGVTGSDGVAFIEGPRTRSSVADFCFEVTDVQLTDATYDPTANVETRVCESGTVYSESPSGMITNGEVTNTTSVYPNPFNAGTNITFSLSEGGHVDVTVYNVLGQSVRHLASGYYPEGTHSVHFDGRGDRGDVLGTGMYFYRISSQAFTTTRKMILLK